MSRLIDLTGQQFDRLTVTGRSDICRRGSAIWDCICECGGRKSIRGDHLRNGLIRSCGCLWNEVRGKSVFRDLTGQRFGQLVALRPVGQNTNHQTIWSCKCDCGKDYSIVGSSLIEGRTTRCYSCSGRVKHGQSRSSNYNKIRLAKRRAKKRNRTPDWADLDAIREFYLNCPEGHHVDHIVPLQGRDVSGLHVINNLQYLPAQDNQSKSNRFIPGIDI